MRIWAKIISDNRVTQDAVGEYPSLRLFSPEQLEQLIHELCQQLDLSRPVLLRKHYSDWEHFRRIVFKPMDFMESVDFDRLEIELIQEKKKKSNDPYAWA